MKRYHVTVGEPDKKIQYELSSDIDTMQDAIWFVEQEYANYGEVEVTEIVYSIESENKKTVNV